MCLTPCVDIIHQFAQHLLVNVVENRVVGTEYEVGRRLLQNLIHLGLQHFQIALLEYLAAVVESAQHGTVE